MLYSPKLEKTRTTANILLVGEHQQEGILHFAIVNDLVELRTSFLQASSVARIHHENQTLCAGVVVTPQGTNLVLATDIPNIELDVLVGHALHVEADGGDCGNILVAEFQFVKNSW